jgi:pyruvate formate-lyase 1-activating enzyme
LTNIDPLTGFVSSTESMGTVDGPGIRFVIFGQGCPLRCLYCHNPETWDPKKANHIYTPEELIKLVLRYKSFIEDNGGVTFSGGEPLMQAAFVEAFFKLCKENRLHTTLDTSGFYLTDAVKSALNQTDLVLLDIKSVDPEQHILLTRASIQNSFRFLDYLQEIKKPVWIRHVIVPGYTDDDVLLERLADYLIPFTTVEKVELLPYHTMGTRKYEPLGLKAPLGEVPPLSQERLDNAKRIFKEKNLPL